MNGWSNYTDDDDGDDDDDDPIDGPITDVFWVKRSGISPAMINFRDLYSQETTVATVAIWFVYPICSMDVFS